MKNISSITLEISSTESYNITNELQINTLKWQERADTAFASGSCQIITDKLNFNIPSYSIIELSYIDDDPQEPSVITYPFLISSTARKHPQIEGLYIHDCELLEQTAILETFVLGSKSFSAESSFTNDRNRIQTIYQLMHEKYPNYTFDASEILSPYTGIELGNYEYTFGAGTTMFAALSEICLRNGYKLGAIISDFNYIILTATSLTTNTAFDISNLRIIDYQFSQETKNYCKYLETEAKNVVDRDSYQAWKGLTCRSEGAALDADHAVIQLPSEVESIEEFRVSGQNFSHNDCEFNIDLTPALSHDSIDKQWIVDHGGTVSGNAVDLTQTWDIIYSLMIYFPYIRSALNKFKSYYNWLFVYNNTNTFTLRGTTNGGNNLTSLTLSLVSNFNANVPMTSMLAEESYWNTIIANDKPRYVVYKSGSRTMYNLNATYKKDFWGTILGITTGNFLSFRMIYSTTLTDSILSISYDAVCKIVFPSTNPLNYQYDVKSVAITKPKFISTKITDPLNESNWKTMTRTYTNSDNVIDMDSLLTDMDKKVEPLGNVDFTMTLDTSDTNDYPKPLNAITFNSKTYYVASLEHTYKSNVRTTQYNLSLQPLKIADAIGVEYQFNPIRLPYYSVIDRPLYFEYQDSIINGHTFTQGLDNALENGKPVIILIESKTSETYITAAVGLYAIVMKDDNDNYILYCECADNYSAGDQAIPASAGKYENKAVKYGNYQSEIKYINIVGYCLSENLSRSDSYTMPNIDRNFMSNYSDYDSRELFANQLVYKDGRERLTFTIKIKPMEQ